MLEITIPDMEAWDESKNEFIEIKGCVLMLEHSLISLSKWESKWEKPFLTDDNKTDEESLDYIRCMTMNKHVDPNIYFLITQDMISKINAYIHASMTATTFNNFQQGSTDRSIITSELIYYWMVAFKIPFECEKWHLNRLLTLIRICNVKNSPTKKMSKQEIASQYSAINASRRKKYNTKG